MLGVTTIILAVIGAIILIVIAVVIAKFLKGSVKLKLDKKSFSSSEMITGKVDLKTKKEVKCNRLYVILEAMREDKRRSSNGQTSTTWRKVYSQEVNLAENGTYPAGYSTSYDFKIKVPTNSEMGRFSSGNKIIDSTIKLASSVMGVGRLKWNLKVILDAKGLDLSNKKRIYVNLSDNQIAGPTTA